jgi:hypothetical protein
MTSRPDIPAASEKIRVLFGTAGWPSGILDVGSWAHHRGLAEVVILQLQPGCAFRLDPGYAWPPALGPVDDDLADAFAQNHRPLSAGAQVAAGPGKQTFEIRDPGGGRDYRIVRDGDRLDVLIPDNYEAAEFAAAIRRYAEAHGSRDRILRDDGTPAAVVEEALVAAGGRFIERLIELRPHVVGFRLEGGDLEQVRGFIRAVRLFSQAEIVLGGPTATSHPRDVLEDLGADYVFAGEAEETFAQFLQLARRHNSKDRQPEIPGLAYRYGGRTYHNTLPQDGYERTALQTSRCDRSQIRCLRNLLRPVAGADVLAANRLEWSLLADFSGEFDSLFFTSGRGCPGACTFCAKLHGPEVRVKSAAQLLEEIEATDAAVRRGVIRLRRWRLFEHTADPRLRPLAVAWAAVFDEDFFLHRPRAIEFLRLWDASPLRERYRLSFQTNPCTLLGHDGRAHGELFSWIGRLQPMIQLGAESFNPDLLARWRKRHTLGQLETVLDALDLTHQDYTVFILLSDFDTTPEELVETLRLLILAALRRRRMRLASTAFTIPLYDSETRQSLEFGRRLTPGRVRHFTDYERPQPGWMDPLAAEMADLADAELRFALQPQHRDAALVEAFQRVLTRIREEQENVATSRRPSDRKRERIDELCDRAQRAMGQIKEARFQGIKPSR